MKSTSLEQELNTNEPTFSEAEISHQSFGEAIISESSFSELSDNILDDSNINIELELLNLSSIEEVESSVLPEEEEIEIGDWFERNENSYEISQQKKDLKLPETSSVLWTKELSLTYIDEEFRKHVIPAPAVFSQLTSSGNQVKSEIKSLLERKAAKSKAKNPKTQLLDSFGDPKPNFLTVNVGFLLSKSNKHGQSFVSLPIRVPNDNFYSVKESWLPGEGEQTDQVKILAENKRAKSGFQTKIRSKNATERLQRRHELGKLHTCQKKNFTDIQISGPSSWLNHSSKTLTDKFHHSEQALFEFLSRTRNIEQLVQNLKDTGVTPGTEIFAIVIDMHSTRYVCENCEIGMQGIMNPDYRFLQEITSEFKRYGYRYQPQTNAIIPRVIANRPDGAKKPKKTNRDHEAKESSLLIGHRSPESHNKTVFEADINIYQPAECETDLHRRTIFTSSKISDNKDYQQIFHTIVLQEYTAMIQKGLMQKQMMISKGEEEAMSPDERHQILEGFQELAKLEAMQSKPTPQAVELAQILYEKRTEFERDANNKVIIQRLRRIGIAAEKIEALSSKKLMLLGIDFIELLEEGIIDFAEVEDLTEAELESLNFEEVKETLRDMDAFIDDLLNIIKDSPEKLETLIDYDIRQRWRHLDFTLHDVSQLYDESPEKFEDLFTELPELIEEYGFDEVSKRYDIRLQTMDRNQVIDSLLNDFELNQEIEESTLFHFPQSKQWVNLACQKDSSSKNR